MMAAAEAAMMWGFPFGVPSGPSPGLLPSCLRNAWDDRGSIVHPQSSCAPSALLTHWEWGVLRGLEGPV